MKPHGPDNTKLPTEDGRSESLKAKIKLLGALGLSLRLVDNLCQPLRSKSFASSICRFTAKPDAVLTVSRILPVPSTDSADQQCSRLHSVSCPPRFDRGVRGLRAFNPIAYRPAGSTSRAGDRRMSVPSVVPSPVRSAAARQSSLMGKGSSPGAVAGVHLSSKMKPSGVRIRSSPSGVMGCDVSRDMVKKFIRSNTLVRYLMTKLVIVWIWGSGRTYAIGRCNREGASQPNCKISHSLEVVDGCLGIETFVVKPYFSAGLYLASSHSSTFLA
mmetsp:Transcript_46776/g.87852  ORF Transcript_46776/g.87852 Transcript_46776/m.87852 type:complete len:272 (+) Transcript_46776:1263-2078(+)